LTILNWLDKYTSKKAQEQMAGVVHEGTRRLRGARGLSDLKKGHVKDEWSNRSGGRHVSIMFYRELLWPAAGGPGISIDVYGSNR